MPLTLCRLCHPDQSLPATLARSPMHHQKLLAKYGARISASCLLTFMRDSDSIPYLCRSLPMCAATTSPRTCILAETSPRSIFICVDIRGKSTTLCTHATIPSISNDRRESVCNFWVWSVTDGITYWFLKFIFLFFCRYNRYEANVKSLSIYYTFRNTFYPRRSRCRNKWRFFDLSLNT